MRILYTSDIHVETHFLHDLLSKAEQEQADVIVIGGDIVPKDVYARLFSIDYDRVLSAQADYLKDEFVPAIRQFKAYHPAVRIFMDLGNDDFWDIRKILEQAENEGLLHLLHMKKSALADNLDIIGYFKVPPTPFAIKDGERADSANEFATIVQGARRQGLFSGLGRIYIDHISLNENDTIEADLAKLDKLIDKPFIFVSHAPPFNSGIDTLYSGLPAGSRAIRHFIERWGERGLLHRSMHGHIHESPGIVEVGVVKCVNTGQMGGALASYTLEIDGLTLSEKEQEDRKLFEESLEKYDKILRNPGMDDYPRH